MLLHDLHHLSIFFFNDTATTEIYTLSLHDALPIFPGPRAADRRARGGDAARLARAARGGERSEEHTSELQSQSNLVCRLLLEKKKNRNQQKSCSVFIIFDYSSQEYRVPED